MSPRHHSNDEPVLSAQALDRVLANPDVKRRLYGFSKLDRDHDLPYLGGYSEDGETFYLDRHLPEKVSYDVDGRKVEFDPDRFLLLHEKLEKALIDALGWSYWPAHSAGNGLERRTVLQDLGPGAWPRYEAALMPYVKADERERLERVPADLDMTPYYAEPVDKALIARMQAAQGKTRQFSKVEVSYSDRGHASSHCGPVKDWPRGDCAHFEKPHGCELVRGYIEPRGWCKKWKARDASDI